jgi:hypothetical protein
MKLAIWQRIRETYNRTVLADVLREVQDTINALVEGSLVPHYTARATAPTTGSYSVGHFIRNSAPSELGSASSKYVVLGFICVTAGTPGTWRECRCLTGN